MNEIIPKLTDGLLSLNDQISLNEMSRELVDTWGKRQLWRTETEIRNSVLASNRFPTKASKYWQLVREQGVFVEQLAQLSRDYRRNENAIARIKSKIEKEKDPFDLVDLTIDLEEKVYASRSMELAAKDRMREIKIHSKIKNELDDGSFDTNDVNNHQLISYATQYLIQVYQVMQMPGIHNTSTSEWHNLIGQFDELINSCNTAGLLKHVAAGAPDAAKVLLKNFEFK